TIGRFHLDGIPPSPRGVPQIEVSFDIDANGILNVSAKDKGTGKEQRIRIEASSGLTEEEITKMKEEAQANAESDKKIKDKTDKINAADSLIFQTEKQLKEFGDKLPADKKGPIEDSLKVLKEAHKNQDLDAIDKTMADLNSKWQAASEEMYKASQEQAAGADQGAAQDPGFSKKEDSSKGDDEVTDVDFEEVK
ncbi:MAG: Hsp70 family protein, partial [Bacteroidales bacterium]|nr:Hsp70 family protein [Bacteroidales bacterium]